MSTNPCQICGCTDLNLVDGFYYCVECGTQDVNVRETVVERTMIADGIYAISDTKKLRTVLQDAVSMSSEWYKWHAYNFILGGLSDELIALGAKPTFKIKVLWIWVRYIKKFQKKDEHETTQFEHACVNEDKLDQLNERGSHENYIDKDDKSDSTKTPQKKKNAEKTAQFSINNITKGMMLSILYVALNLDKSDIQLAHLFQYIREGRLSLYNCSKFVPKELSLKVIPQWYTFNHIISEYVPRTIRGYSMSLFKQLELGVPLVPDLNKIIDNYITELCLPNDFKDLVISLTSLIPCDFLQLDSLSMKDFIYTPDYETVCMAYVVIALKMCFGLDCDYEIKLSDAVDKINCEEGYLKSYKLGMYSEPIDRLFSFKEWYMFIQFRKMILCRHYLPMARQYNLPVDDYVFMMHLEDRGKGKTTLSEDVTMDILNKIHLDEISVIPKREFPATLTPMTTYTEIILEYINDPDLKLRLCEDFTQYTLKYATKDLKLPIYKLDSKLKIKGVNKADKVINKRIMGTLTPKKGDRKMVFVRNCENKNWLTTKPPKRKHITKKNDDDTSDYESESNQSGSEDVDCLEHTDDEIYDTFEEEDEGICIFDDDFKNFHIDENDNEKKSVGRPEETDAFELQSTNLYDSKIDIHDDFSEISTPAIVFNPKTFDREKVIKELIEITCKKYKIPLPKENEERRPIKRKRIVNNEGVSEPKRKKDVVRMKPGEAVKFTQALVDAYYENINSDILLKMYEQVKSAIEMTENQVNFNISSEAQHDETEEMHAVNKSNNYTEEIDNSAGETNLIINNDEIASVNDDIENGETVDDDDEENITDELLKTNPKFDAKTHDIKQLYISINEELGVQEIAGIDISDPDIDSFIDRKIAESQNFDTSKNDEQYSDKQQEDDGDNDKSSDRNESDDDDVEESVMSEQKMSCMKKRDQGKYENLVTNTKIKKFRYWMRHYKTRVFRASNTMTDKFDTELAENCPKSFVFVINECASISECTNFTLYKCVQKLEERLSKRIKND